ncbi:uncharacterized protein B0P05DRAFT_463386 [Gilbertella persicaria]|uniref:uncharacterized protein n=1 Tax=Gilbertella persicaria TaxID=101096 RepID=UPI00221E9E74|nr:uncharacterized protein B0P05DRAFT_463386 [Gilbertella persicaria]KAI8091299.1 hypothetical protein B0P05DRAFT_463386 [Gilbertella persicaria]
MSSQPTTPQPTSDSPRFDNATTIPSLRTDTPASYPSSPSVPLEQKYANIRPNTPTANPSSDRKVTFVVDNSDRKTTFIHDTCPSFGPTEYARNIIALDRQTIIEAQLHVKVDRGFFLADNDWTCYRRNYFQVSGSFSLEGVGILYEGQELPCFGKDPQTGQLEEIDCFMLGVCARLSDCEKPIQLVQHTPKRDKGPQTTPIPKMIRPGGNVGFSAVGSSQSVVTFERLQFKTATANNGKRRAAQQYYVIIVELLAKLRNGNTIAVATSKSSPLVVRGRSPGHYAETDSGSMSHSGRHGRSNAAGGPISSAISHASPVVHHPYGRPPSAAASNPTAAGYPGGAGSSMFQPTAATAAAAAATEYMPYDYHGVAYTNYHMPPPPPPPMAHSHSYPGTPTAVPMMQPPQHPSQPQQSQQHYLPPNVHDRATHSSASSEAAYPSHAEHINQNTHSNEYEYDDQQQRQAHNNSPYYWQRQGNDEAHHDHWNRIRMASNNSGHSSVDNSQHNSPYMSHPQPPQQPAEHSYYSHQPPPPPPPPQSHYAHHPGYNHHHHPIAQR